MPSLAYVYHFQMYFNITINTSNMWKSFFEIKNRLRSTLSQNSLTPLMLISIEKDISKNINKEDIIKKISKSSVELKRLLQLFCNYILVCILLFNIIYLIIY